MAFLTVGGVTVQVAVGGADRDWQMQGDFGRAEDGTPLASLRDWVAETRVSTVTPMTVAERDTLMAALQGTPPIAITGDWSGTMDVIVTGITEQSEKLADGERRYVSFTYMESP